MLSDVSTQLAEGWESTQSSLPSVDEIAFLQQDFIQSLQPLLRLPAEVMDAWCQAAERIRNHQALVKLCWHYHRLLYADPEEVVPWSLVLPSLKEPMGDLAGMFTVVVLFSGFTHAQRVYQERGIPKEIMTDTFADAGLWMDYHWRRFGRFGLHNLWMFYHISGRLFRLGRLQFARDRFRGNVSVYRLPTTNQVLALLDAGLPVRSDGQINGTSGITEIDGIWISERQEDGGRITGAWVSPDGRAVHQNIRLNVMDWEPVLANGNSVLDIHVPEGEKLSVDRCGGIYLVGCCLGVRGLPIEPRCVGIIWFSLYAISNVYDLGLPTNRPMVYSDYTDYYAITGRDRGTSR